MFQKERGRVRLSSLTQTKELIKMSNETQIVETNGLGGSIIEDVFNASNIELSLVDGLVVLNEEQHRTIFAIYGKEGIDKYKQLLSEDADSKTRAEALNEFIGSDIEDKRQKELVASIVENHNVHTNQRDRLKLLKLEVSEATREKNKQQEIVKQQSKFTDTLKTFVKDEEEQALEEAEEEELLKRAREKRDRLREQGIRAYLKGVVAAVIDECDEDYIAVANKKAKLVVRSTTEAVKESLDKDKLDPKSIEATKRILSATSELFNSKSKFTFKPNKEDTDK